MPDLQDGQTTKIQGSGAKPYELKNVGGVYSCTCPAWRNQSLPIERRTCKHLRAFRGEAAEEARIGSALPQKPKAAAGKEAAAPPLLLAERWQSDVDLAGWWMSEKLDGVRAYWNGREFISRLGNLYHAPDWFTAGLPNVPLDGELWIDRKKFQRTVSIVKRQDKSDHWNEVTFVVFDAPLADGLFEQRMDFFTDCLRQHKPPHARAHKHQRCQSIDHLKVELAKVEALGGEGLMLRKPGTRYEAGRSATLLKVKNFHDAEARVLKHLAGAGRHKGRLGALFVELDDGTQFAVGTGLSDAEREDPPPVGSFITFRYQELSEGGVPRFPSYVGARTDLGGATAKGPAVHLPPTLKTPVVPKTVPPAAVPGSGSALRRFELVQGSSRKFWEVTVSDDQVTVRYGRIGSQGQARTKTFAHEAAAARHADKLITEKTKEGYQET
jgi:DNA ligase-1